MAERRATDRERERAAAAREARAREEEQRAATTPTTTTTAAPAPPPPPPREPAEEWQERVLGTREPPDPADTALQTMTVPEPAPNPPQTIPGVERDPARDRIDEVADSFQDILAGQPQVRTACLAILGLLREIHGEIKVGHRRKDGD